MGLAEGDDISLVRLQDLRNLLTLLLDGDELLLLLPHAIEGTAELAHEALDDLRCDILLPQDPILNGLLKRIEHDLCGIWLSEHAGGDLLTATLGGSRVRGAIRTEEELGVAGGRGPEKGIAVSRGLCHGLAEAEWISGPRIDDDGQVVGGDGARDCGTTLFDSLDSRSGGAVLQDDAELGELGMELSQNGQEPLLRGQDRHVASGGALAVQVQNQSLTLHLSEDRVERRVVDHAGARVGGYTGRVALDSGDTALLGFNDGLRGDCLVQIQRHEVVDIGLNGLQALLVVQGMVDGGDGGHQVGLRNRVILMAER